MFEFDWLEFFIHYVIDKKFNGSWGFKWEILKILILLGQEKNLIRN